MGFRLTMALAAAVTVSCVHERRIAGAPVPSAPATVWDRQIHNATDGGDGDYVLNTLRRRVAAEPDNIPVRLDLARAYRERGYPEIALEICRLAVARFPESGEAQLALVHALHDLKRPQEAIAVLEARPGTSADYFSWLGILRDQSGAWDA